MNLTAPSKYKRIVQLELNEISASVVGTLCARGELPNFKRVLDGWACLETTSEDEYHLIEPWIQWVTAHTGKTFAEHGIFHLGNQAELKDKQIWELLSEHGIVSAIVGSMNARHGSMADGVFIPDPWAKIDETYPRELSPLWRLFSKKVQQHATQPLSVRDLIAGGICCLKLGLSPRIYFRTFAALVQGRLNPRKKWRLAAVFDDLLAEIFLAVARPDPARYYTLFLNSVAHFQHHYWRNFDRKVFNADVQSPDCEIGDDPVLEGYRNFDRILGRILTRFDPSDTLFIIVSGLSQEPYLEHEAEGGMNYYRLKDHRAFARKIGIEFARVLPLMSRDWRVECSNSAELEKANRILQSLTVAGQPLFAVTRDAGNSLFIETAVTAWVSAEIAIETPAGERVSRFDDEFVNIAVKSGHHTGIGALWISDRKVVASQMRIPLTDLYGFTARAFGISGESSSGVVAIGGLG